MYLFVCVCVLLFYFCVFVFSCLFLRFFFLLFINVNSFGVCSSLHPLCQWNMHIAHTTPYYLLMNSLVIWDANVESYFTFAFETFCTFLFLCVCYVIHGINVIDVSAQNVEKNEKVFSVNCFLWLKYDHKMQISNGHQEIFDLTIILFIFLFLLVYSIQI